MGKFLLSGQKSEYLTVKCGIQAPPNVNGEFELNDGNHRHKAYENLKSTVSMPGIALLLENNENPCKDG
jgi:hypothetical protein